MAMRNYRAMVPENLIRAYRELTEQRGDAYERLVKGRYGGLAAWEAHVNTARDAMTQQGLAADLPDVESGEEGEPPAPTPSPVSGLVEAIPPMLAWDARGDFSKVPTDGWIMEPKIDGWRWQAHITEEGVVSVGGRNGVRHDRMAPMVDKILAEVVPAGTVLDGELLLADGRSSDGDNARFVVFDVLVVKGKSIMEKPWEQRRKELEYLLPPIQEAALIVRLSPYEVIDEGLFGEWLSLGFEGCVAKRRAAPYIPGSRRRDGMIKVKPQSTTDAIVTGWLRGKGVGNRDRCGALEVKLVETGKGTTCAYDATPEEADEMIDRRVELAHHGFFESGSVKHPIFKRLRPDLEPAR